MNGVYDRRAPKSSENQALDRIAAAERKRRLDAAIKALSEFDEKYGSFADEYIDEIL